MYNAVILGYVWLSSRKHLNRSTYRNSEITFTLLYFNSGIYMITTVDITAMTQILRDQKVTITHMGFLRKMIHRPVMILKDLLGDGCYLQHRHVSTLRTICLQIQNYLNLFKKKSSFKMLLCKLDLKQDISQLMLLADYCVQQKNLSILRHCST